MKIVVSVIVSLYCALLFAQEARVKAPRQDQLFLQTKAPAHDGVPFPADAGFLVINTEVFDRVTSGSLNIDRVEDFPMPDGSSVTLLVEEFSIFNASSRLVATSEQGDRNLAAPAHILLRGNIEDDAASHVYLAVFRDHVLGYIEQPGEDRTLITPALKASEGIEMTHIVYRQYDVDPIHRTTNWNCEADEFPGNRLALDRAAKDIARYQSLQLPQATQTRNLSIAVECDNEFFKDFPTTLAAQQYAIEIIGAMSDIYMRDANCAIKASFLRIWETADPYTGGSTSELLPQFQEYWNDNMGSVERATALLFSGDNNLGGGLAYLDVLCMGDGRAYAVCGVYSNYTYPNDKYIWDNDVTSHEFGHNVGSVHTHNCSWAPPVDSCVASEGGCYSTPKPRKGTIMSYCHLTASGTELKIHTRVGNFMKQKFAESDCAPFVQIPEAKAPADKVICKESSVPLTGTASKGTPPYKTLWFAGNNATKPSYGLDTMTLLSVNASPAKTTPYVFRVTDANNVRAYDTVIVEVDTVKIEMGPNTISVCGADSVTMSPVSFSGRGKVTFEWRENASDKLVATGQTVKLPADTMTYKVIATDSIGCTGYDLITINPLPGLNAAITAIPSSFCDDMPNTLDAGTGYTSYSWSTGATTRTIEVSQSGTYSCVVTKNGVDCADTALIIITKNPSPAKPTITFENNILKCPIAADSFQWFRQSSPTAIATTVLNSNTAEFAPISNGYYHVKVLNEFGCFKRSDTLLVVLNSVEDNEPESTVKIYPNPAKQNVTIDAGTGPALSNLYITDVAGKTMWSSPRMSDQIKTIVIDKWSAGSYVLHYTAAGKHESLKFIKE